MNKRTVFVLLIALMGASLLVLAPKTLAIRNATFSDLQLLVDVRHELVQNYVEEPDEQEMTRDAIRGMIESLEDPYTVYLSPEDLAGFDKQVRGSFSGIGAEIGIDEASKRLKIISPLEDSPAWNAGVMAGDIVMEIEGESTVDIKLTDAVEKLTGPEGTKVNIKVRHPSGEEENLTITRARINVQTVRGIRRDAEHHWNYIIDPVNKIGYVRLSQFTERTEGELREVLTAMNADGIKGLILDLRFNPGGLLPSAVAISNMFLNEGETIVSVKGRRVPEHVEKATQRGQLFNGEVAVLINGGSASASEIVAGALLDNNHATVIGSRSFGKGSVQQVKMLDDNLGALKMTNAYYYLPSGRNIHRRPGSDVWGVDPQEGFYVPMTAEAIETMVKIRMEGDALRREGNGDAPDQLTPQWVNEHLADPQLAAGLEAMVGKLTTGEWPQVGRNGAQDLAMLGQRDNLQRQRGLLMERLDEIEEELDRIAAGDTEGLTIEEAAEAEPAAEDPKEMPAELPAEQLQEQPQEAEPVAP